MTKREILISLAVRYRGNYDRIFRALRNGEKTDRTECEDCLTILDDEYPRELLELKEAPFVLFTKGRKELLKKKKIAVVGSRDPCTYALKATEALVRARSDMVLVSGLAKGIDACAHAYAAETIGVLGCGIERIYPFENAELYQRIGREGLLLSEYPGNCPPFPFHFPFRNRIIAALAEEVYVMEAKEKSGTLTTVDQALELGRDVRVLPFPLFDSERHCNNRLIAEGALMIEEDDLLN